MVVSEEILAPLRVEGGVLSVGGRSAPPVPHNFFTPTVLEKFELLVVLAFTRYLPVLKPGREWLGLVHQCGGHKCEQELMVATRLTPRPSVIPTFEHIVREGFAANHFYRGAPVLASRFVSYVAKLTSIGLDCECTWPYLTEGLYPIDATQDNLDRIADDAPDLETIADWKGFLRARYSDDPVVFLITENSD